MKLNINENCNTLIIFIWIQMLYIHYGFEFLYIQYTGIGLHCFFFCILYFKWNLGNKMAPWPVLKKIFMHRLTSKQLGKVFTRGYSTATGSVTACLEESCCQCLLWWETRIFPSCHLIIHTYAACFTSLGRPGLIYIQWLTKGQGGYSL